MPIVSGRLECVECAMTSSAEPKVFDVIVVGAGAAGIGVSVALQDAGIENFMILERFTYRWYLTTSLTLGPPVVFT